MKRSFKVLAAVALLALAVGSGFLVGAKSSAKSALRLENLETSLRAAEELKLDEVPNARAALEQIAILELTAAASVRPQIDDAVALEIEGLCRAMRYFAPEHPSAGVRDAGIESIVSILRPYLSHVGGEIQAKLEKYSSPQVFFPQCASYFGIEGKLPCIDRMLQNCEE